MFHWNKMQLHYTKWRGSDHVNRTIFNMQYNCCCYSSTIHSLVRVFVFLCVSYSNMVCHFCTTLEFSSPSSSSTHAFDRDVAYHILIQLFDKDVAYYFFTQLFDKDVAYHSFIQLLDKDVAYHSFTQLLDKDVAYHLFAQLFDEDASYCSITHEFDENASFCSFTQLFVEDVADRSSTHAFNKKFCEPFIHTFTFAYRSFTCTRAGDIGA